MASPYFYEPKLGHGLAHDPFKAIVAPRPIGWVTTMSAAGEVNLSPYSFFNIIAEQPHLVAFSSQGRKDAMTFAEEGGDFVCNFASWDLRHQVNETSAPLPRGENEMRATGLDPAPARIVRPPLVSVAPAALECLWVETIALKSAAGAQAGYHLVIGEVVGVHIDDRLLVDGIVDTAAARPLMRGGYREFFTVDTSNRFSMERPQGGGRRDDAIL
jgi:flavin reductase (DIM6/NTAB) family NADH-FMN oxidoreductase RutF